MPRNHRCLFFEIRHVGHSLLYVISIFLSFLSGLVSARAFSILRFFFHFRFHFISLLYFLIRALQDCICMSICILMSYLHVYDVHIRGMYVY